MSNGPTERERTWAPVRFPPKERLEITQTLQDGCRRVYELQAEDDVRFAAAAADLLQRLDLSAGVITGMTCDKRFALLLENWAASCDRFGIECRAGTIVFPTDREALELVESLGFVAYFDDDSRFVRELTQSERFGDAAWTGYMYHQNWVIKQLLNLPADVLFQDVDLVWRRDPIPFLLDHARAGADIQAMYDGPNDRFQPLYANSGFMYFRNTEEIRAFWAEVYARHDMVAYYGSQQQPLNVMLAAYAQRGLDVRILDEDRFANGHRYCGGRTAPLDPWVVHNSWTGDLAQKLERYEANGLWFLDRSFLGESTADETSRSSAADEPDRQQPESRQDATGLAVSTDQTTAGLLELLGRVRRERDALQLALDATHRSRSWRLTSPLRRAKKRLCG